MSRPKRRRGPSSRSAQERPSLDAVSGNLPCAICGNSGRGPRTQRHLTHGVAVWLCDTHGSGAFMHRRAGREFTDRVAAVWTASGVLTVRRKQALEAHLRRVRMVGAERDRPGSYSWPVLRREAERRFAAGEPPPEVIADLRGTSRDGPAMVPSVRTMRRWFTQARWLERQSTDRRQQPRTKAPATKSDRAHPLVELILTGTASPSRLPLIQGPRGP